MIKLTCVHCDSTNIKRIGVIDGQNCASCNNCTKDFHWVNLEAFSEKLSKEQVDRSWKIAQAADAAAILRGRR